MKKAYVQPDIELRRVELTEAVAWGSGDNFMTSDPWGEIPDFPEVQ